MIYRHQHENSIGVDSNTTVQSTVCQACLKLINFIHRTTSAVVAIIIPILQMGKLKHWGLSNLADIAWPRLDWCCGDWRQKGLPEGSCSGPGERQGLK